MIQNNVLIGKDDFLFLHEGGHHETSLFYGTYTVSQESISSFNKNIDERDFYCRKKGIKYLHVVFPSKHVVYENKLPDVLQKKLTNSDLVKGVYKRSYRHNKVLYPENILIQSEEESYNKDDTHLSDKGYILVLKEILSRLSIKIEFEQKYILDKIYQLGDLGKMINQDPRERYVFKEDFCYENIDNINFLSGNSFHSYILFNNFSLTNKRILIFGDSFFHHMAKFFISVFKEVLFFRSANFDFNAVEMFSPDYILTGNAERYLSQVESDEESGSIILSMLSSGKYATHPKHAEAIVAALSFKHNKYIYEKWIEFQSIIHPKNNLSYELDEKTKIIDGMFCGLSDNSGISIKRANAEIIKSIKITIVYKFLEEVDSYFQIFLKEQFTEEFTEIKSLKQKISIGINVISISLKYSQSFKYIKILPANCRSVFDILEITLD